MTSPAEVEKKLAAKGLREPEDTTDLELRQASWAHLPRLQAVTLSDVWQRTGRYQGWDLFTPKVQTIERMPDLLAAAEPHVIRSFQGFGLLV